MWQRRLRWDYRSSTELLLGYLDSRILPGYVALTRGKICGYAFCVYESHKAVIGDIYASTTYQAPLAVTNLLAEHLLETLTASPDLSRIEAQLLLFDQGAMPPAFQRAGFSAYPRLFLERDLPAQPLPPTPFTVPAKYEIVPWAPAFYQPTAQLIQHCYLGHIDAAINDQYRTLAGCLRFLHNVIRFPGCGTFDPASSWLLRQRDTQALEAAILCSRVAPDTAHVTQLCVLPGLRGKQVGRVLLDACIARLPARNYRALSLTVTEANTPALRLYQSADFRTRHRFEAVTLNK